MKMLFEIFKLTLFVFMFYITGCESKNRNRLPVLSKKEKLIKALNETDCFSKERYLRDSLKNIEIFLVPKRIINDSINNLIIELYFQTIHTSPCMNDRVIVVNFDDNNYIIPYCQVIKLFTSLDSSLFNYNTEFGNNLKELIIKKKIKYPLVFLDNIFKNITRKYDFMPEKHKYFYFEDMQYATPSDSVKISLFLSDSTRNNYDVPEGVNTFWSIRKGNKNMYDVEIVRVNSKMIKCYAL